MQIAYQKLHSTHLNQEMEFKTYGYAGKPVLVFPTGCGRFFEFEDFGMLDAVRGFVEAGRIQLCTVDSVDCDAWMADWKYPADRGWRHLQYERYVLEEMVPFIREYSGHSGKLMTVGCDVGGYHAANFFFKHPDVFDAMISMSGLYGPEHFIGGYMDDNVYFNFPLIYLPNLKDDWYLDRLRESTIIACVGQGMWEEKSLEETQDLEYVLNDLDVPARIDYWGTDVNHDWPWWQRQLPYYLDEVLV